jgi:uncharacterized protein (TIGR03546 family)
LFASIRLYSLSSAADRVDATDTVPIIPFIPIGLFGRIPENMVREILKNLRDVLLAERSPEQIAGGVALGVAVGLIPKANLICLLFVLLIFVRRTNLAAGLVSAMLCSWISPVLDPITGVLGRLVLEFGPAQALWAILYRLPIVPWTSFNNTVVMGNLVLAMLVMPPIYFVVRKRLTAESSTSVVPPPRHKQRQKFVVGQSV